MSHLNHAYAALDAALTILAEMYPAGLPAASERNLMLLYHAALDEERLAQSRPARFVPATSPAATFRRDRRHNGHCYALVAAYDSDLLG